MRPPLALVHDYLTQRGGAERVVAAWCRGFPDAPLYTSLYESSSTFPEFADQRVVPSKLNRVGAFRADHRRALPLLAPTMSNWHIDADTVLASTSGWAHGVRTNGRLVVYCHAPARWLYQRERYLRSGSLGARASLAANVLGPALRRWDRHAARRADLYVANSTFTRDLIRSIYDIDASVIAPPVSIPAWSDRNDTDVDVLIVARLLPYKNVDIAIDVARTMPSLSFRVVGDGPLRAELESSAPNNVRFDGVLADSDLWHAYASSRVHLTLSHEDFGITPLEAAAAGRPTVARNSGGFLDTITPSTGVLIDDHDVTVESVSEALRLALGRHWDRALLRQHAESFSIEHHLEKIRRVVDPDPSNR